MKKYTKGFTLVELMVIVGLIAVLLAVILVNLNKSRMRSRDNIRVAHIQTIRLALEEYRSACGVFPETLEITANNGRRGTCLANLGDFIGQIPSAPERPNASLLSTSVVPAGSRFDGYFYAGLSSVPTGPCYEYHLGVELEMAENNNQNPSSYLDEDHDFEDREGEFDHSCGSTPTSDFGTTNAATDDLNGLYDFRSVNNR